jgi:hypothetical protein
MVHGLPFDGGPSNGAERYFVAHGLIRSSIARVSTNGLKADPACRRPCAARSKNWTPPGATEVSARMAPFLGSMATTAAAGSFLRSSCDFTAARAARWSFPWMVVCTLSPPRRTVAAP